MKTTVKKLEDSKILLTIEVPKDDVEELLNQAARAISERMNIPGFRKGAAPRSVVEAKVGKQAVAEEVLNGEGLSAIYSRAITEIEHEPIARPDVEIKQAPESGKSFIFEATVEVKPEIDLSGYDKVKVKKETPKVTKDEVNKEVDGLRDRFAEIKETLKDKVENGVFAVIDFQGTVDGKPLEGGIASDYLLDVGSGTFWPGFEDQLIGMKIGDKRTVTVEIPEEYFEKALAGKTAIFDVTLKGLKTKVVPELDEEFAKKVGFESVEGFRKDVENNILSMKQSQADLDFNNKVIEAVSATVKTDAPQIMVDDYTDRMLSNFVRQLGQVGATMADYLDSQSTKLEDFRKTIEEDAAKAAKSDLVLEAIAKKENITVSDEELEAALTTYIEKMGEEGSYFTSGPDAMTNRARLRTAIKMDIARAKTIEFLVGRVGGSGEKKSKEAKS